VEPPTKGRKATGRLSPPVKGARAARRQTLYQRPGTRQQVRMTRRMARKNRAARGKRDRRKSFRGNPFLPAGTSLEVRQVGGREAAHFAISLGPGRVLLCEWAVLFWDTVLPQYD